MPVGEEEREEQNGVAGPFVLSLFSLYLAGGNLRGGFQQNIHEFLFLFF